jgi:hypothetical protein
MDFSLFALHAFHIPEGPTKANTKIPDGSTVIVMDLLSIIQIPGVPFGFWHSLWQDLPVL